MRLSPLQKDIIKQEAKKLFGTNVIVKLFGSRTNDRLKGGDIDLLLELPESCPDLWQKSLRLNTILQKKLGEQKIDIITQCKGQKPQKIHEEASRTGIAL